MRDCLHHNCPSIYGQVSKCKYQSVPLFQGIDYNCLPHQEEFHYGEELIQGNLFNEVSYSIGGDCCKEKEGYNHMFEYYCDSPLVLTA